MEAVYIIELELGRKWLEKYVLNAAPVILRTHNFVNYAEVN